ncbi:MAG: hypothetical protein A2583_04810 [Bdellovibrionales bacterium RIFOXYD1_FULL_53_11]|nr:MAG: hypothetical protein A2583_04810 [Bdellovibrionales bacterium RIFOXYD1_FULL_53_11]
MFAGTASYAGIYDDLNDEEKTAVQKGEQVVQTEDVDGAPWPKITVYQRIEATPEEVMAVFWDFERHPKLFGKTKLVRITKTKVSKRISRNVLEVDYTMKFDKIMGIQLDDENYTLKESLVGSGETFTNSWTKVKTDKIEQIEGSLAVEKLGTGAVVAYYNYIFPPYASVCSTIADLAVRNIKETVANMASGIEDEKKNNGSLLQKQLEALRKALGRN